MEKNVKNIFSLRKYVILYQRLGIPETDARDLLRNNYSFMEKLIWGRPYKLEGALESFLGKENVSKEMIEEKLDLIELEKRSFNPYFNRIGML